MSATSDGHGLFVYRIDRLDRISYMDDSLLRFAEDNGAPELVGRVVGSSLWSHISGDEVQILISTIVNEVRATNRALTTEYRCDAPDKKRLFRLQVVPLPDEVLEFRSTLVRAEDRAPVPMDLGLPLVEAGIIVSCAWCRRFKVENDWIEVEEALNKVKLLELAAPPGVSHGICPDCLSRVRDQVSGLKG